MESIGFLDSIKLFWYKEHRCIVSRYHKLKWTTTTFSMINYIIILVSIIITICTFSSNLPDYISIISTLISILCIAIETMKRINSHNSDFALSSEADLPPINAIKAKTNEQQKVITYRGESFIYNPDINKIIDKGSNPIIVDDRFYSVHPIVSQHIYSFIKKKPGGKYDWDDIKSRLRNDITQDAIVHQKPILLQKTSYFRSQLSNALANNVVRINQKPILNLREEVIDKKGKLISLERSTLSNHLGGGAILFTQDSKLVYLVQNDTAQDNHAAAPSGSGSFEYYSKDKLESISLQDYIRFEIKREIQEECNLTSEEITKIQICGFGRALHRGGKPDAFCIARTTKYFHELSPPIKEWIYQSRTPQYYPIEGELNKENTINALKNLKHDIDRGVLPVRAGLYLYWNVCIAIEYLETMDDSNNFFEQ